MTDNRYLLIPKLMAEGEKGDTEAFKACFCFIKELEMEGSSKIMPLDERKTPVVVHDPENFAKAHGYTADLRGYLAQCAERDPKNIYKLYRDTLLFDAPYDFDCFCRYIEWEREPDKRFYMPFLRGVYDELSRIVGKHSEYLWQNVFPETKLVGTNAKDLNLDLGTRKRFSTFMLSSVGAGNAGKIRAANLLYLDDLVDGIETAMNRERLDKLWQQYYTDYRQRKIGDCAELHIATRWSVHDVIGRLDDMYSDDPTAEFIVCPALDENDESNFDYPYNVGFTTEFYREQREIMDTASWKALYMNEPIEREGQLYPQGQLQRYFELPEGDPDAIIGVCDTKTTGSDFCSMPIAFQYGNKFYIEDVLFENYAPNVVETNLVSKICQWNPHMIRFESNVAGGKLASDVQQAVKAKNCRTKIETKWTQQNKETKILVEAPWVLEHCVFKDDSVLHGDQWREYRKFLQSLCSYSLEGKNKHDDAPDSMAQLSQYIQGFAGSKVQIVKRMF